MTITTQGVRHERAHRTTDQHEVACREVGALAGRRDRRPADPRVSIVVPTLNEARNLEVVLPRLAGYHEVVLVDGGSVDDTVATARRIMPEVRVFSQSRKGKGNAMAEGFRAVTGDVVVMFDADGSADAAEIPAFVSALLDGADFAKGSRFRDGGGSEDITTIRRMGNAFLNGVANTAFSTDFTDLCYGYNAFWADMIPVLDLPDPDLPLPADGEMLWGDGFEIETLINCRFAEAGARIVEVPSLELERIFGESHLRAVSDGLRVLHTLATERRRAVRARRVSVAPSARSRSVRRTVSS